MTAQTPPPAEEHVRDFTVTHYRELLRLARANYPMTGYDDIEGRQRFLLWRHDCDFSLNRALALALIEQEEGVRSTYFVNLHSEFYNLLEKSQAALVRRILGGGHALALHFDAAFHDLASEDDLDVLVRRESDMLAQTFGVSPTAFSFHNPTEFTLRCERSAYGGLLNCYASRFKSDISYCSDSNGYWRHRRLYDVLSQARDEKLQVLTHPDWWLDEALHPRQRVHRAVHGRAHAAMRFYDDAVKGFGRTNVMGPPAALEFLRLADPEAWQLCDDLWNAGHFATLFIELWALHSRRIRTLVASVALSRWGAPADEIGSVIGSAGDAFGIYEFLTAAAQTDVHANLPEVDPGSPQWQQMMTAIVTGEAVSGQSISEAIPVLCKSLERIYGYVTVPADERYFWPEFVRHLRDARMVRALSAGLVS